MDSCPAGFQDLDGHLWELVHMDERNAARELRPPHPHSLQEIIMQVQPYLVVRRPLRGGAGVLPQGRRRETEMVMRFNDSPEPTPPGMVPPGSEAKVMHACFRVGASTLMASNGSADETSFEGFSLSLLAADEAEAKRLLTRWPTAARSRCPLPRPSGRRPSAWWKTALALVDGQVP